LSASIAVYPTRFKVRKGQGDVVGVGVLNTLRTPNSTEVFMINSSFIRAIDADNNIFCDTDDEQECFETGEGDVDTWLITDMMRDSTEGVNTTNIVQKNTQNIFLIGVRASKDAKAGTYIFSIDVFYHEGIWKRFGPSERFYIDVY
jgi:hypothetical protein